MFLTFSWWRLSLKVGKSSNRNNFPLRTFIVPFFFLSNKKRNFVLETETTIITIMTLFNFPERQTQQNLFIFYCLTTTRRLSLISVKYGADRCLFCVCCRYFFHRLNFSTPQVELSRVLVHESKERRKGDAKLRWGRENRQRDEKSVLDLFYFYRWEKGIFVCN